MTGARYRRLGTKQVNMVRPGSWDERDACRRRLYDALVAEMEHRPRCAGLEWINNERQAIVDAANRWASSHTNCATVTVDAVETIEHRACGHVDYASKLAMYVTDLVYGPPQTM